MGDYTLEQALALASENAGNTLDDAIHVNIDTREITVPQSQQLFGVESDDEVEIKHIVIDGRYADGNRDLSQLAWRVVYRNANRETSYYLIPSVVANENSIEMDWLIKRSVVAYKGTVDFILCAFATTSSGEVTPEWNSTLGQGIVLEGLETSAIDIGKESVDELAKILYETVVAKDIAKKASEDASASANRAFQSEQASENIKQEIGTISEEKKQEISELTDTKIKVLQDESTTQQVAITKKGADTLATIPEEYTQLNNNVGQLKEDLYNLDKSIFDQENKIIATIDDFELNKIVGANKTTPIAFNGYMCGKIKVHKIGYFKPTSYFWSASYPGVWLKADGTRLRNIVQSDITNSRFFTVPEDAYYVYLNSKNGQSNYVVMACDEKGTCIMRANKLSPNSIIDSSAIVHDVPSLLYHTDFKNGSTILTPDHLTENDIINGDVTAGEKVYGWIVKLKLPVNKKITAHFGAMSNIGGSSYILVYDILGNRINNINKYLTKSFSGHRMNWYTLPDNADYILSEVLYDYKDNMTEELTIEQKIAETLRILHSSVGIDYQVGHVEDYWPSNKPFGFELPIIPSYDYYGNRFTNRYYKKAGICFGDSITSGGYPVYIGKYLDCSVTNKGSSGSDVIRMYNIISGNGYNPIDYSGFAFATIMIGHNSGISGSLDDYTLTEGQTYLDYPNTGFGNIGKSICYMQAQNPDMKIYLCTLHKTTRGDNSKICREKLYEIGEYFSLPVIDVYSECGIGWHNLNTYSTDGTHVTDAGNKLIGECVAKGLVRY